MSRANHIATTLLLLSAGVFVQHAAPAQMVIQSFQVDGAGSTVHLGMPGQDAAGSAKTPLDQERRTLGIIRAQLLKRKQQIEDATLTEPDVAAALDAARKGAEAYYAALAPNTEYQGMKAEQEALRTERRELYTRGRDMDKKERNQVLRDISEGLKELSPKIADFADTVPELAALNETKTKASVAFCDLLDKKLEATKEWKAVTEELEGLQDWSNDLNEQSRLQQAGKRGTNVWW